MKVKACTQNAEEKHDTFLMFCSCARIGQMAFETAFPQMAAIPFVVHR